VSDKPARRGFFSAFRRSETPEPPEPPPHAEVDAAAAPPPAASVEEPPKKGGWFQRLKQGLAKTSARLSQDIAGLFTKRKLDAETLEELEDLLIQADLGVEMASRIATALAKGRHDK
jgi:fused signal recognition particle receptor